MKKKLEEKLSTHLLKIIFNNDLSINEQVAQVYQYLKQFEGKEIRPEIMPITIPTPKEIKLNIYNVYKQEEHIEIKFLERLLQDIADYLINEERDRIFKKTT